MNKAKEFQDAIRDGNDYCVEEWLRTAPELFFDDLPDVLYEVVGRSSVNVLGIFVKLLHQHECGFLLHDPGLLFFACEFANYEMIEYLFEQGYYNPRLLLKTLGNLLSMDGDVLPIFSIFFKHCPELRYQTVFTNVFNVSSTLFHIAIEQGKENVLDFLLQRTDPQSWLLKDSKNDSILDCALNHDSEPVLEVLEKYGFVRFCIKDEIPLHNAYYKVIQEALLEFNPDFDKEDSFGNTTLHVASKAILDPVFFETLVSKHQKNVAKENEYGETPLFFAIVYENAAAYSVLMRVLVFDDIYKTIHTLCHEQKQIQTFFDSRFQSLKQFIFDLNLKSYIRTDAFSIVCDYLGFDTPTKKRKFA